MNPVLKAAFYVVLVLSACAFGHRFIVAYSQRMDRAVHRLDAAEGANARVESGTVSASGGATGSPLLGLYAIATLGVVGALGLMLARDISTLVAQRVHKELYDEEGEGMANPEYEQAEQTWANGEHLEAVRLMREYLRKNAREQHVAIRIAEIYEQDLKNPLAAALEYEEILTKKLPAERWGWCAIHLCNLYYRIGRPEKTDALLRRIVDEYPDTAAAEKARKRLAQEESGGGAAGPLETGGESTG